MLTPNTNKTFLFKATLIILFMFSAELWAQDNSIKSIDVRMNNGRVIVVGHFKGLINANMKETLASGMSSSLHFNLKLLGSHSRVLSEIGESIFLRFNVWEKVYSIRTSKKRNDFKNYHQFESFINDSLVFDMGHIKKPASNQTFKILLSFSPENISTSQKNKLNYWLKSEGEIKQSRPAYESESGFSVNLTSLISIFFKKKDHKKLYVFKSAPFTIHSLKTHENITR